MKIKSFLIMVLSLISLTVAAQNGGSRITCHAYGY